MNKWSHNESMILDGSRDCRKEQEIYKVKE